MFSASECNRNNAAILRFAERYDILSELRGILTTLFAINLIANTFRIGILRILAANSCFNHPERALSLTKITMQTDYRKIYYGLFKLLIKLCYSDY